MTSFLRILGIFILLSSALPLGLGLHFYKNTSQFLLKAISVEAEVVENIRRNREQDNPTFAPVFSFHDLEGREQKIYSRVSAYPPRYGVGDKVVLLYDPQDPKKAKVNDFLSLWLGAVLGLGVGTIWLLTGLIFLLILPLLIMKTGADI